MMKDDEEMFRDAKKLLKDVEESGVSTIPSKPTKIEGNTGRNGKPLPPNAGKGRPKGSPNKTTKTLREAITQAFDDLGGAAWVKKLAEEDTRAFVMLLAKVIPPAPKDVDELVGLAERLAEARLRMERARQNQEAELHNLTDEEFAAKLEGMLGNYREHGSFGDDALFHGVKDALARPKTLEGLVAGSWEEDRPIITGAPCPEPSEVPPERIPVPAPVAAPVMPPLPGVKPAPSPRQSTDEQLPGQAVNSHRRALADDHTSSRPGKCIMRGWEE